MTAGTAAVRFDTGDAVTVGTSRLCRGVGFVVPRGMPEEDHGVLDFPPRGHADGPGTPLRAAFRGLWDGFEV